MPINKYDVPAQAEFINTYVPLPFQELFAATQQRRGVLNENLARLDAAQARVDSLKYIPNSTDQTYIESARRRIADLADRYAGLDLSDPEIYRKLRSELRSSIDVDAIDKIQQSYAGYETYMKELARLEASGRGTREELRQNFTGYNTLAEDQGIFNQLPTEAHDWKSEADRFFAPVKEMFTGIEDVGHGYLGAVHERELSALQEYANQYAEDFARTPSGIEMTKVARAKGDNRSGKDIALEYLYNQASTHQSKDTRILAGSNTGPTKPSGNFRRPTTQMQGAEGLEPNDFLEIGEIPFDEDNKIAKDDSTNPWVRQLGVPPGTGEKIDQIESGVDTNASREARYQRNQAKISKIKHRFPELRGLSDKEAYDAYKSITKDMGSYRSEKMDITLEQSDAWRERFGRDVLSRDMSYTDKKGNIITGKVNDKKGPIKDLGYTPATFIEELNKDPKDSKIHVAGVSTGGAHSPGTLILQVIPANGKGEAVAVHISTNDQFKGMMTPGWIIHENMINGIEDLVHIGYDAEGNPIGVQSYSTITEDENGKWRYTPTLKAGIIQGDRENGLNFVDENNLEDISFPDVSDLLFEQALISGYIGLDFHNLGSSSNVQ